MARGVNTCRLGPSTARWHGNVESALYRFAWVRSAFLVLVGFSLCRVLAESRPLRANVADRHVVSSWLLVLRKCFSYYATFQPGMKYLFPHLFYWPTVYSYGRIWLLRSSLVDRMESATIIKRNPRSTSPSPVLDPLSFLTAPSSDMQMSYFIGLKPVEGNPACFIEFPASTWS